MTMGGSKKANPQLSQDMVKRVCHPEEIAQSWVDSECELWTKYMHISEKPKYWERSNLPFT